MVMVQQQGVACEPYNVTFFGLGGWGFRGVGVRVLTAGVVPSRGAVCAVVAIRDRVFRLELTSLQCTKTTMGVQTLNPTWFDIRDAMP